jgi:hypothetical protein
MGADGGSAAAARRSAHFAGDSLGDAELLFSHARTVGVAKLSTIADDRPQENRADDEK